MKKFFLLLLEELLPFVFFAINKYKALHKIQRKGSFKGRLFEYCGLSVEKLNERLEEEHERAVKIDEKTAKFTLGLSVSLTILVTVSGALVKLLPPNEINSFVILLCGISSIFMMIAGIVSLGALKTLPKYGYGTQHELLAEKNGASYLAGELVLQEDINIIRHLRNETAYQCLRNGFIVLLIALIFSVFLMKLPISVHKGAVRTSTPKDNAAIVEIRELKDKAGDKKQTESIGANAKKLQNDGKSKRDNK
jgi:hypothetical protein